MWFLTYVTVFAKTCTKLGGAVARSLANGGVVQAAFSRSGTFGPRRERGRARLPVVRGHLGATSRPHSLPAGARSPARRKVYRVAIFRPAAPARGTEFSYRGRPHRVRDRWRLPRGNPRRSHEWWRGR